MVELTDDAATTVYGRLLHMHMVAARKRLDGPEQKMLFEFIKRFRQIFPDECQFWEDRYAEKSPAPSRPVPER